VLKVLTNSAWLLDFEGHMMQCNAMEFFFKKNVAKDFLLHRVQQ
jgi:hypothetical protein